MAYDPQTNLVLIGQSEWCTTVRLEPDAKVRAAKDAEPWMGNSFVNPLNVFGIQDPHANWAGCVYATDADSGEWKWRLKRGRGQVLGVADTVASE